MFALFSLSPCELIVLFVIPLGLFAISCLFLRLSSELEISRWFTIALAHFKGSVLLFAAYALFVVVILFGLMIAPFYAVSPFYYLFDPFLLGIVTVVLWLLIGSFLGGPLMAGLSLVALKHLKGERWKFSDFFGGFRGQRYIPIVCNSLVKGLIVYWLPFGPGLFCLSPDLGGPLVLAGILTMICLKTCFGLFTGLLILDRNYGAVEAFRRNWEMSKRHFGVLLLFVFLLGLINWVGALFCFVGLAFTLPFTVLATTVSYMRLTGALPPLTSQITADDIPSGQWNNRDQPTFTHVCPRCAQQVTVPASVDVIRITCPKCNHQWDWNYFEEDGLDLG